MHTKESIQQYLDYLNDICYHNDGYERSTFANMPYLSYYCISPITCTDSASLIASFFDGKVYGYFIEEHDERIFGSASGGHDFAIVGNYLVDWWIKYIEGDSERAIFDMNDPADMKYINEHYFDKDQWEDSSFEFIKIENYEYSKVA